MTDIQIFKNEQFGEVRTIEKNGEPWFVANDVCRVLDFANSSDVIKRLDDDEKSGVVLTNPMEEHKTRMLSAKRACTHWCWGAESRRRKRLSAG